MSTREELLEEQVAALKEALSLLISNTRLALIDDAEAEANVRRATEVYEDACKEDT